MCFSLHKLQFVEINHLSLNKFLNPFSGPLFSVPAIGCPGTKILSFKIDSANSVTFTFDDPTSLIIVLGKSKLFSLLNIFS